MTICTQNLKESNDFLNLLLSNINSAVLIVDENLNIHRFLSPPVERLRCCAAKDRSSEWMRITFSPRPSES